MQEIDGAHSPFHTPSVESRRRSRINIPNGHITVTGVMPSEPGKYTRLDVKQLAVLSKGLRSLVQLASSLEPSYELTGGSRAALLLVLERAHYWSTRLYLTLRTGHTEDSAYEALLPNYSSVDTSLLDPRHPLYAFIPLAGLADMDVINLELALRALTHVYGLGVAPDQLPLLDPELQALLISERAPIEWRYAWGQIGAEVRHMFD